MTYKQLLLNSIKLSAEYLLEHTEYSYFINAIQRILNDVEQLKQLEENK